MMRYSKYGAKRTEIDGIVFASMAESRRYLELKLLVRAGEIENLELQPVFNLVAGIRYVADFGYMEKGKRVIEDVKGFKTKEFKIKEKLFHYFYPELELRLT